VNLLTLAADLPYRPFIDPLDVSRHWYLLLIPISFFIALAYKAVRVSDVKHLPKAVLFMTVQVVLGMAALGVGFWLLIEKIMPLIAVK
jgi:hypothetical protein